MNKKQIKPYVIQTLLAYRRTGKELRLLVPIKAITKSLPNVRVIPYSKQMRLFNISQSQMYHQAGTKDAYTDYDAKNDMYIIYYNDTDDFIMTSKRYRWNIAHELGHVVLKHHSNIKTRLFRNTLSNAEYNQLEYEADQFASYILTPHIILHRTGINITKETLRELCNISREAAGYRITDFLLWRKNNRILDKYDKTLLTLFLREKICENCLVQVETTWFYCPMCGKSDSLKTQFVYEGKCSMKYKKLENVNGKLTKCPICKNEEMEEEANYCHICGCSLTNRCYYDEYNNEPNQCQEAIEHPIPSNARYCPYCGSRTEFYINGVLRNWQEENDPDVALKWDSIMENPPF